ncbi:hypothetical protein PR048_012444 [Dryococelus australis]|uniref:Uncharacterized protein n=1 Tax=Dryococelus australis TaxID=614101 RepID=A0ABQ9HPP3_9NEOP|nr:hypothetical protein PR048_012444 [Dryococelus australis]
MTEVKSHRRKRSLVWQYFEEGDGYAKCLQCLMHLKTPTVKPFSPCTSNLSQKQPNIVISFKKEESLPPEGKEAKTINTKIAKMLAMCHLPYRFVEEKGFVDLVHYLKPSYKIPESTTFSRTIIPELYQSERQKLQQMLKHNVIEIASQHNNVNVAMTTDNWTSRAGHSYMSFTCHYLHEFEYKTITLGNVTVNESHTGENL